VVADDLTRSICLLLPLLLLGVLELAWYKPDLTRVALPAVAAANLVLPASHVIACWVSPLPIFYLYAEIDNWRHPPPYLVPDTYVQQGIQLANQGDFSRADRCFADALRLDDDFSPALLARAITRINRGNLEGARQDAEHALRCTQDDPEAHFVRAVARLRLADPSGAAADIETALRIAPPEWPRRREAQDILAKVKSQIPNTSSGTSP
jgi:tetratricopeptide (TPR) repeat protein